MRVGKIFFTDTVYERSCFSLAKLRLGSHFREFAERKLANQVARS